jgi:hypothetical protein
MRRAPYSQSESPAELSDEILSSEDLADDFDDYRDDPARWRLVLGSFIVGLLTIGLIVVAIGRGGDVEQQALEPGEQPASRQSNEAEPEPVVAARRALEAWGRFAVSGDLDELHDYFDVSGPQYGQLRVEAPALRSELLGPPAYRFVLSNAVIRRHRPERVDVAGKVSVSRSSEKTQTFNWVIVLRRETPEAAWSLWTVKTK